MARNPTLCPPCGADDEVKRGATALAISIIWRSVYADDIKAAGSDAGTTGEVNDETAATASLSSMVDVLPEEIRASHRMPPGHSPDQRLLIDSERIDRSRSARGTPPVIA
jgi:hypothetical protein